MDILHWVLNWIDLDSFIHLGGEALDSKIGSLTIGLTIAFRIAWKKVQKDMKADMDQRFQTVTVALHSLESKFSEWMNRMDERILKLEKGE